MHRKEDVRFLRGEGNYVDDVQLPGMLYGAILRSPYAHARINGDRHLGRRGAARRQGGHHRRGPRDARPRLDAHAVVRHPGGPRHRQGPVPGPGGRVRRRGVEVHRARRARADRRRLRAAPRRRGREEGPRARRADHPRRQGGQDRQPHLRLGGGQQGRHRRRLRQRRGRRHPGRAVPARAPGADGDLRLGRAHGPDDRQAQALDDDPGPARAPHRLRARRRTARAEHPGDQPGHRRRLRQQGADLPRVRLLDRRLHRHRQAGEVDGGPRREPHVDGLRPRLPHEGVDRLDARGQDPGGQGRRARRPRRVQRGRPADEVPGRLLPHLHRLVRLPGGATAT